MVEGTRPRASGGLERLAEEVTACRLCPRLVEYRERVAREKKRAFREDSYWGRPVPGFGDPRARVVIVGLAPAAHGANRTGRMFTGDGTDGSGASDFLMRTLHGLGFANLPVSRSAGDGLRLRDAYMTAIVRCAPPGNRPTRDEIARCAPFLRRELALLENARVIVALGREAFEQVLRILAEAAGRAPLRPKPRFAHGAEVRIAGNLPVLLASYHPSRQNTQTGKLTASMFRSVFERARELARRTSPRGGLKALAECSGRTGGESPRAR